MIFYKLRQDNRGKTIYPGHWFAHAYNIGTTETKDMARLIEANCSVKRSDVMAVLIELSQQMRRQLAESHRVRLEGIGTFMVGLRNRPCPTYQEFSPDYIEGMRVNFQCDPEMMPSDATFRELPVYTDK